MSTVSKPRRPKNPLRSGRPVPPGATSTTTPGGVAVHDPAAITMEEAGLRMLEDRLKELPAELAKNLTVKQRNAINSFAAARSVNAEVPYRDTEVILAMLDQFSVSRETPAGESQLVSTGVHVPLAKIDRHPLNRHPTSADVEARAVSLAADGQLEDCVVRMLGDRYQMISGETRLLAARKLKWPELSCKVIRCDDAEAARRVALHNAERADLNPIQKAQLIESLASIGFTRDQAAKAVGLASHSAASNLVRLLQLPKLWQDRVASGELPESFARLLLPVAHAAKLLEVLDESYRKAQSPKAQPWEREAWESRSSLEVEYDNVIGEHTRPMDGKKEHYYSYNEVAPGSSSIRVPRLFARDEAIDAKLGVVTLEIEGAQVEVATDAKAYDKLNIPLVKKLLASKTKSAAAKSGADGKPEPKKLTAAELRAKEKLQADQLKRRIAVWRHQWLKSLLAEHANRFDDRLGPWLTLWLATSPLAHQALAIADPVKAITQKEGRPHDAWDYLRDLLQSKIAAPMGDVNEVMRRIAIGMLSSNDTDSNYRVFSDAMLEDLAVMCRIDLDDEWHELQRSTDPLESAHYQAFFLLHQTSQLEQLAEDLAIDVSAANGKQSKIAAILEYKQLPRPQSIKPIEQPKPAKKRGGK